MLKIVELNNIILSYAVNKDDIFLNYNFMKNRTKNAGLTQIAPLKCSKGNCSRLPSLLNDPKIDFAYFSSTSVHNGEVYVSFNERTGANGSIYGVVKKYNETTNTWDGVCGGNLASPGTTSKVISKVTFDSQNNPQQPDADTLPGKYSVNLATCSAS